MYKIIAGSTHGLHDTGEFIESLGASLDQLPGDWRRLFVPHRELIVTRAPGRIDLMGGIGDYSGSLVLTFPIANATHVALQRVASQTIRIASLPGSADEEPRVFEISLKELTRNESPIDYAEARAKFARDAKHHWAAYVVGAFLVLMHERRLQLREGAHLLIHSSVPEGKGVSSSAALEVAVMRAITAAFDLEISARETALLCQTVENQIAGAPCGVMDQMTASCGQANHLLALLCQPAHLEGMVALPEELEIWGIDSGVSHSIGGASYGTVRTATFMGYRIIADVAGLRTRAGERDGHVEIEDQRWNGYLANVSPEEFEREFAAAIPERMSGKDFLQSYQGITDAFTSVDPGVDYPVRCATVHPIYENRRVKAFAATLQNWKGLDQAARLGEWMTQAHQSYSACGLGSSATDRLVELALDRAPEGIFGAKISGGGNGGTVAIVGRRGAGAVVEKIAERYRAETGRQAPIISGSSSGTESFGYLRLIRENHAR